MKQLLFVTTLSTSYFRKRVILQLVLDLLFGQLESSMRKNHSPLVQGDSTGVSCLFLTQGLNPDLSHCRQILYHLSHQAAQECWNGQSIPSPGDLPNSGIKPGSPTLQVDSLPAELLGKQITLNVALVRTQNVFQYCNLRAK